MKGVVWTGLLAITVFYFSCDERETDREPLPTVDDFFVEHALRYQIVERQFDEIAASRAGSNGVKTLAMLFFNENSHAHDELLQIATHFSDVEWNDDLDSTELFLKDRLHRFKGYSFDTTYLASRKSAVQSAVALYQLELDSGRELLVKEFARTHIEYLAHQKQRIDSVIRVMPVPVAGGRVR